MNRTPRLLRHLKPVLWQRSLCASSEIRKTCLFDFHVAQGGRMVEFAGFMLPVQYASEGLAASHKHVRSHCGVFDVSHMLQTEIRGKDRVAFLESLCVADIQGLPENGATLTVFTNQAGGIIDDLVVTRTSLGYLHIVSNAGRRDAVRDLIGKNLAEWSSKGRDVTVKHMIAEKWALLAVQGPSAAAALQPLVDIDLTQLRFMSSTLATIGTTPRYAEC
ncbi:hypothetical protein B566_EDAN013780 [Ephemera danica]|nr:hypothetical protein B566_EDAN013780 [Ephemera danica]